jgi:hypothetical protein
MMLALLALIAAAVPVQDANPDLQPAPQATIVAGGKACIGTTVDPASQAARTAGWTPMTAEQASRIGANADGSILLRDNVMLIYQTGVDGGCVVMAKGDAGFDPKTFYPALSAAMGVTVPADAAPAPIALPNGEILIAVVTPDPKGTMVQLVVANPNGKHAKQGD